MTPDLQNPTAPRFVGTREALAVLFAESVRPSPDWLVKQAKAGRVRATRIGRRLAFDLEQLHADLSKRFQNNQQS